MKYITACIACIGIFLLLEHRQQVDRWEFAAINPQIIGGYLLNKTTGELYCATIDTTSGQLIHRRIFDPKQADFVPDEYLDKSRLGGIPVEE